MSQVNGRDYMQRQLARLCQSQQSDTSKRQHIERYCNTDATVVSCNVFSWPEANVDAVLESGFSYLRGAFAVEWKSSYNCDKAGVSGAAGSFSDYDLASCWFRDAWGCF